MDQYHRGMKFEILAVQTPIFKSASAARHLKSSAEEVRFIKRLII
jgi:hypothetical protein